jgi:hypothetical protein
MNLIVTIYSALLFFVLTPGILLSLPPKGKPITVAIVHAVVFALVFHFTHKFVWRLSHSFKLEGLDNATSGPSPKKDEVDSLKLQLGNMMGLQ